MKPTTHHERAVRVLERRVGRKDRVVWLNDGAGELGSRVHAELELGLLAVVRRETLEKERAETRASATAEGVEDEEALKTLAVVRLATQLVHRRIDELLTDGVVATSVCVGVSG